MYNTFPTECTTYSCLYSSMSCIAEVFNDNSNFQALQSEIDRLQDDIDNKKKEMKEQGKQLSSAAEQLSSVRSEFAALQEENAVLTRTVKVLFKLFGSRSLLYPCRCAVWSWWNIERHAYDSQQGDEKLMIYLFYLYCNCL